MYWEIGNRVKQYQNLENKLKSVNISCFSTISVKIYAK